MFSSTIHQRGELGTYKTKFTMLQASVQQQPLDSQQRNLLLEILLMIPGPPITATSRSKRMRMLLILISLACLEHVAANPVSGSQTGVVKNDSNVLNFTKISSQGLNSGFTNILDRKARALTHFAYPDIRKYKGDNDMESNEKPELNSKSIYIIPHMRPGRSELSSTGGNVLHLEKRDSDTLIPTLRFGRSDSSLIPIPRLGRSTEDLVESGSFLYPSIEDGEAVYDDFKNIDTDSLNLYENEMVISSVLYPDNSNKLPEKREVDDNETVIPYPRLGRDEESTNGEELSDGAMKRESNDSLIPQIRYGRDSVKVKVPPLQKPYFILPNMRPGRSLKNVWIQKEKTASSVPGLVPYPRPGRVTVDSEGFNIEELIDAMFVSSKQMDENAIDELVNAGNLQQGISGSNSLHFFDLPKELKKESAKSEQFVIPYPRPGKRYFEKPEQKFNNQQHLFKVKGKQNSPSDYVLPYPRPGKRNGEKLNIFESAMNMPRDESASDIIDLEDPEKEVKKRNTKYVETALGVQSGRPGSSVRSQPRNILPYPRPGRTTVIENEDYLIPQLRFGRSNSIVPYPRLGRSDTILPYPRLGRSNTVLPYPRLGRSDTILPYPRLGRSDTILPYPRLGRSNSLLPYPRLGRSNSLLPYPRLGRSESLLPYPRLGRSELILPYPRLGRSDTILPYPRLGRSNSILPYPRLGRSDSILPYPRLGRSESILPYPRLGRSDSLLPYPRLGRSDSILPYPRLGRSDSILPYPRLGRSKTLLKSILNNKDTVNESSESASNEDLNIESLKEYLRREESEEHSTTDNHTPSKKENEHILTGDSIYLLPYPRPGRNA